jgi:hypothetical protein
MTSCSRLSPSAQQSVAGELRPSVLYSGARYCHVPTALSSLERLAPAGRWGAGEGCGRRRTKWRVTGGLGEAGRRSWLRGCVAWLVALVAP